MKSFREYLLENKKIKEGKLGTTIAGSMLGTSFGIVVGSLFILPFLAAAPLVMIFTAPAVILGAIVGFLAGGSLGFLSEGKNEDGKKVKNGIDIMKKFYTKKDLKDIENIINKDPELSEMKKNILKDKKSLLINPTLFKDRIKDFNLLLFEKLPEDLKEKYIKVLEEANKSKL